MPNQIASRARVLTKKGTHTPQITFPKVVQTPPDVISMARGLPSILSPNDRPWKRAAARQRHCRCTVETSQGGASHGVELSFQRVGLRIGETLQRVHAIAQCPACQTIYWYPVKVF